MRPTVGAPETRRSTLLKQSGHAGCSEKTLGHRVVLALRSHLQKNGKPGRDEQRFPQGLAVWMPEWANDANRLGELSEVLAIMRDRQDNENVQDVCACIIWGASGTYLTAIKPLNHVHLYNSMIRHEYITPAGYHLKMASLNAGSVVGSLTDQLQVTFILNTCMLDTMLGVCIFSGG